MPIIYEPMGKAREYSALAANYYKGCSHGCVYCYVPSCLLKTREEFHSDIAKRPRVLEEMERDLKKLSASSKSRETILFSFTSDPYQPFDSEARTTREAIALCNRFDFPVQILTKGGLRSVVDLDILSKFSGNKFAATLTVCSEKDRLKWEPNAPPYEERVEALRLAHEAGVETWVSFEPVLYPEDVYKIVKETAGFVDLCKVGKLNHHPHAKTIDWKKFAVNITAMLDSLGKSYRVKEDLRGFINVE